MHSAAEQTQRHDPLLWIALSGIKPKQGRGEIEIHSLCKRQATFGDIALVFYGIEADFE
jgi:hypothetical protein